MSLRVNIHHRSGDGARRGGLGVASRRRERKNAPGHRSSLPEIIASCLSPSLPLRPRHRDIAFDVVSLLIDLTDTDVLGDHDDPAHALVAALVDNNALELLARLSEADPDEILLPRR
ncbi:uncharacterized protein LOC109705395 [Ananas comosus]|uniref:Uncharacterized protein LOC109705395 n=1 Tax=Ananas comosus TaxID=4615 RepID=A0A6P5EEA1_ANACO|nr:uncharacterized protein LOC109705395 [Ananas comosus]